MRTRHLTTFASLLGLVLALLLVPVAPATAAARVSVTNEFGTARIDSTYTTTLTLQGQGFRSIRNGFGGIYVLFGTVTGSWRPSAQGGGGSQGSTVYVPDSQTKDNAGYQRFVAYPGGETADSANGGTIAANGRWSTTINVPGPTFKAVGSDNRVRTVDCRKVTCGVITVGAHGVANSANETFTPVKVADLYGESPKAETGSADTATAETAAPTSEEAVAATATPTGRRARAPKAVAPVLEVDRASAGAGKILAFSGAGLLPGSQVSAVFDDGEAGAGPFVVGAQGQVAGLLQLPADTGPGTHELRLVGATGAPSVRFAVTTTQTGTTTVAAAVDDGTSWPARVFVGVAALVLAAAVLLVVRRLRRRHVAA